MGQIVFDLFVVFLLVFLNGFFVTAEFAFVKIRSSRLTQLINEGVYSAKIAKSIVLKLDAYLSACQLGITLASLGLGWIGEPLIAMMLSPVLSLFKLPEVTVHTLSFLFGFIVITVLHITLGELAPKSIAIQNAEVVGLWLSFPMMVFYKVTYPAIYALNYLSNLVLKILGLKPYNEKEYEQAHTEEEIRILVDESHKNGLINKTESTLVDNVFQFSDRVAREAMIPRTSAIVLYIDDTFEENFQKVIEGKHTRYPIAEGEKDNIIGFVHISDIYASALKEGEKDLSSIIRKILTVPESMELSHVLRLMQKHKIIISAVMDEYGGVAGILTLEDIVEEIVGEIQDEFDYNERPVIEKLEDSFSVDGRMLIDDFNNMFSLDISNSEVDTVGGWVHMMLEDMAEVEKEVNYNEIHFRISEMDKNRIVRIIVKNVEQKEVV